MNVVALKFDGRAVEMQRGTTHCKMKTRQENQRQESAGHEPDKSVGLAWNRSPDVMDRMITSDSGRQFLKEACAAVSTESETDRFDLEGAIQALLQANRHLLRQIKAYDDVLEEGLARARGGLSIQDAMRTVPPVAARNAVEAAITELFETRRHVRRDVIAVTLQDGLPVEEVATVFEIPIDVVHSIAAELPGHGRKSD
jgi:hypothetical protein